MVAASVPAVKGVLVTVDADGEVTAIASATVSGIDACVVDDAALSLVHDTRTTRPAKATVSQLVRSDRTTIRPPARGVNPSGAEPTHGP
ncbi:MAG: hypothetical protein QM733_05380 [Ilumatobacteraceae bacterium]